MLRGPARSLTIASTMVVLVLTACGGGEVVQPALEGPVVRDLWVDGYCFHETPGSPAARDQGAIVFVREGGHGGRSVPNVVVRIEEQRLSYDESIEAYTAASVDASSGDSLRLTVSNGKEAVSATAIVPSAPKDLFLGTAHWDIAGPEVGNTLRWTPPAVLGEELVVYLYAPVDGQDYLVWTGRTNHSEADYLTVYNSEIPYYSTRTSISALVCQANYGLFADNPDHSAFTILAGVRGTWATSR